MNSVMNHNFNNIPAAEIQRSSFDRSHGYKTTFNAGYLIPIYFDEALPGDTHVVKTTIFARLATLFKPVMDNMKMDVHFFAVPVRTIWKNFKKFMGEQDSPGDSTDYLVPTITITANSDPLSIHSYFGFPASAAFSNFSPSALFHRSYNAIFQEWYRDENLQDAVIVNTDDGPDDEDDYTLLKRGKRHDYFTSCLPWPQKGAAVTLPLGDYAPIGFRAGPSIPAAEGDGEPKIRWSQTEGGHTAGDVTASIDFADVATDASGVWSPNTGTGNFKIGLDPDGTLIARLDEATAATINSLREAFQLQKMLERDARGGTRYTEIIKAHFNVTSPDSRLQRPEYLGGGTMNVIIHPVTQMAEGTDPVGDLKAFGTASGTGIGFTSSFTEHCIIMGIASVRSDLTYSQGIDRMFWRSTRFDFYWPALSHLGEQAVLNREIYYQDVPLTDTAVFGYQERYAEYKFKKSMITGNLSPSFAGNIAEWTLSQAFGSLPVLNDEFIVENPPMDRIKVAGAPDFILDSYFQVRSVRPMPVYSVPGLIDHF